MKKYAIAFLIFLVASPVLARSTNVVVGFGGVASKFCDTKTGYLLCEDFEGTSSCESGSSNSNCRNTWVAGSNACLNPPNYGYTTALSGVNSVFFDESSGSSLCSKNSPAFASVSNQYAYFTIKINELANFSGTENVAPFCIGSGRCCLRIAYNVDAVKFGASGSADAFGNTTTPTQGTQYHIWLDYVGTSCSLYVSTTGTKPASPEATATVTDIASTIVILQSSDTDGYDLDQILFDNILVDDASIGDQ